jgi:hypothetical protein
MSAKLFLAIALAFAVVAGAAIVVQTQPVVACGSSGC